MDQRAEEIEARLAEIDAEALRLRAEQSLIYAACLHERRPSRKVGDEYRDKCPDCGFVASCLAI